MAIEGTLLMNGETIEGPFFLKSPLSIEAKWYKYVNGKSSSIAPRYYGHTKLPFDEDRVMILEFIGPSLASCSGIYWSGPPKLKRYTISEMVSSSYATIASVLTPNRYAVSEIFIISA